MLVAKSTHQPGEEVFPPSEVPERERLKQRDKPRDFAQDQGEVVGRVQDTQTGGESEWDCQGHLSHVNPLGEVTYEGR